MNKIKKVAVGFFISGLLILLGTPAFANPVVYDPYDDLFGWLFLLAGAAVVIAIIVTIVVLIIRKMKKK